MDYTQVNQKAKIDFSRSPPKTYQPNESKLRTYELSEKLEHALYSQSRFSNDDGLQKTLSKSWRPQPYTRATAKPQSVDPFESMKENQHSKALNYNIGSSIPSAELNEFKHRLISTENEIGFLEREREKFVGVLKKRFYYKK